MSVTVLRKKNAAPQARPAGQAGAGANKFISPDERKDFLIEREGERYAGMHLLIDLKNASRLDDIGHIDQALRECVTAAGATLLHIHLHHFTPNGGVSGVAVLAESHISIHTWPEYGYAALDVFMCGAAEPHKTIGVLKAAFQPGEVEVEERAQGARPVSDWHEEGLYPDVRTRYQVGKVLYDSKTEHQKLRLFEHPRFGKILTLDDVTQTTEKDEFVYHEMMTHVPILAHGAARRVLIIGGGDGGILEEVLKHPGVENATMVEIDAGVVEFSKQYLSEICKDAFDDPRTDLVIDDGFAFMGRDAEAYDVIIVDSTDPQGPGEILFTREFYRRCKTRLTPGGVLVTQNGVPFMQGEELRQTATFLREFFADVSCYLATIPTYVCGAMAMGWASDNAGLRRVPLETLQARCRGLKLGARYYTPEVHKAAFALPPYVSDLLA